MDEEKWIRERPLIHGCQRSEIQIKYAGISRYIIQQEMNMYMYVLAGEGQIVLTTSSTYQNTVVYAY